MSAAEPVRLPSAAARRRGWLWGGLALAVLALAAGAQGLRFLAAGAFLSTGRAAWIWSAEGPRQVGPRAFYALEDFTVEEVPERARLLVQGDEEYLLYLNGVRVGSNRYRSGAPLDAYEVASLLVPGANRLVAELRSSRGAGGFLLRLEGGGEDLAVTDGGWRLFGSYDPGLLGGWRPAEEGEPPKVWGRPPAGRWGRPSPGPLRPLHREAIGRRLASPVRARTVAADPGGPGEEWRVWDWGREVTGYLSVEYRGAAPRAAVLFARPGPPPGLLSAADGFVAAPRGAPSWEDAVARTFRYAGIVGPGRVAAVTLVPVKPAAAAALAPPAPEEGLFGIAAPRRLSPLEKEVRDGGP